jgi:type IX secretion system substrate protein
MKIWASLLLLFPFALHAQTINTFAGGGISGVGDGGPATAATIADPVGGIFDQYGNYYIASNLGGNRIRKVDTKGIITTVAGNGTPGYTGDGGLATSAHLYNPASVAFDSLGNFYIAEIQNCTIRKVDIKTGVITTIAGNGSPGYGGDNGPATAAILASPNDICFDKSGNLYIADAQNDRVRKISTAGIITTILGDGTPAFSGDDGPATAAQSWLPWGLAIDDTGNLYVAEDGSDRVRKISTTGIITTVAGNGGYIYTVDGIPATNAPIAPCRIRFDQSGNLIIADDLNYRVLKVDVAGILHSIAGNGTSGFTGDGGPATAAEFNYPSGIAIDACGNLYIPDASDKHIRKISYPPVLTTPSISLSGIISAPIGSTITVTATVTNAGSSYIIHWLNHGTEFTTTTVPSVTYTKPAGIDTITARIVPTGYGCYDSTTSSAHIVSALPEGINNYNARFVQIYPNPATASITIVAINKINQVTISNLIGQTVASPGLSTGGEEKKEIDISGLPPGIYIVKVTDGEGQKTVVKIVKQ